MRHIIFRGKRLDNGEWVEGYLADIITGVQGFEDRAIIVPFGTALAIACDPSTVGQYTGLKDRYGDRIWEGDILRSENGYAEPIGWSQDNAGFATMDFANGEYIYEIDQFLASTKTISGTIHDNPDLLK